MASTTLPKVLWLLLLALAITSASITEQHGLKEDYPTPTLPYICTEPERPAFGWPPCCPTNPPCNRDCPGHVASDLKTTTATRVLGAIEIVLDGDKRETVQAVADLTTRRSFITSTLVDALGLGSMVRKLPEIDVHAIEIGHHAVTITEFILLCIANGIDGSVLRNEIFEVVPIQKSESEELILPNLVVSLSLLSDAGALAINPGIFTAADSHTSAGGMWA
jgi:hypothetical protein